MVFGHLVTMKLFWNFFNRLNGQNVDFSGQKTLSCDLLNFLGFRAHFSLNSEQPVCSKYISVY